MTPQPGIEIERITGDLDPGTRSCWGFMHAPLVRHRDTLYAAMLEAGRINEGPGAVPWQKQDGVFRVYRKTGNGPWTETFRGGSQQTVCLLMSPDGALRIVGGLGPEAWMAAGPGQADRFSLERLGNLGGHPYQGAGIGPEGNACVSWCEDRTKERIGFYDAATGKWTVRDVAEVPQHTGYPYVVVRGRSVDIFKHEAVILEGKYCYRILYHLHAKDGLNGAWKMEVLDDASPGHCECHSAFVDREGRIHVAYRRNPREYEDGFWDPSDPGHRFFHLIGPPGGPFERSEIEAARGFHRVRLCQTPDGLYHLFLERADETTKPDPGYRDAIKQSAWNNRTFYCRSADGRAFSDPRPVEFLPDGIDRLFLLEPSRFGGNWRDGVIEGYTTGGYPGSYMNVYYLKIDPAKL